MMRIVDDCSITLANMVEPSVCCVAGADRSPMRPWEQPAQWKLALPIWCPELVATHGVFARGSPEEAP